MEVAPVFSEVQHMYLATTQTFKERHFHTLDLPTKFEAQLFFFFHFR